MKARCSRTHLTEEPKKKTGLLLSLMIASGVMSFRSVSFVANVLRLRNSHLLGTFALVTPALLQAHGMDKYGPHQGYIQMPGNFHTEIVREKNEDFIVYLLDGNLKNPTSKNSFVEMSVEKSGKKNDVVCRPENEKFRCKVEVELRAGDKIMIKANYKGASGLAVYKFPLKFR